MLLRPTLISLALWLIAVAPAGATAMKPAPAQPCLSGETFASLDETAAFFIARLSEGSREELWSLALDEQEFRGVVWPHLPAARPGTNFTPDFVWEMYDVRNRAAFDRLLAAWGGTQLELVDVRFGAVDDYEAFRIHRDPMLRVRDAAGRERSVRLFGSVIEHDGRFKLYAFRTE